MARRSKPVGPRWFKLHARPTFYLWRATFCRCLSSRATAANMRGNRVSEVIFRGFGVRSTSWFQAGPALASAGPNGSTFAGPHSEECTDIFEGCIKSQWYKSVMLKRESLWGDTKLGVSGGMPPSFTYLAETSTNISVIPNKSRSYYIQYLLSGQVPTAVYGRPNGHVLKYN